MSFSSKVKQEILDILGARHCKIAEFTAITDNGAENSFARQKLESLMADGIRAELPARPKSECCKKAYLRGAYLSCGTMADPRGAYHMEFAINPDYIAEICEVFTFFDLRPKRHKRKSQQILYFKEAEQIATVLNIVGAHVALMEFENCRVGKDVNNAINRAANAAAANENKVIAASAKHIKDILDVQNYLGLSFLGDGLTQVAQMRLDNPLLSLEDIGKKLVPPISKSGVNHRLRKISQLAETCRQNHAEANPQEVYND